MSTEASLNRYAHQWGATDVPFNGDHCRAFQQEHRQVRQAQEHLTQSASLRSLMLLSGPNGVGKSRLLGHWRDQLDPRLYVPIVITQASLSHAGLLNYLARKLGKPGGTRSTVLMHLEEAFGELGEKTAVLILDEAQNYNHAALDSRGDPAFTWDRFGQSSGIQSDPRGVSWPDEKSGRTAGLKIGFGSQVFLFDAVLHAVALALNGDGLGAV